MSNGIATKQTFYVNSSTTGAIPNATTQSEYAFTGVITNDGTSDIIIVCVNPETGEAVNGVLKAGESLDFKNPTTRITFDATGSTLRSFYQLS